MSRDRARHRPEVRIDLQDVAALGKLAAVAGRHLAELPEQRPSTDHAEERHNSHENQAN